MKKEKMIPTKTPVEKDNEIVSVCMTGIICEGYVRLTYYEYELKKVVRYQKILKKQRFQTALVTLAPYSAMHEEKKNLEIGNMHHYLADVYTGKSFFQQIELQNKQVDFPKSVQQVHEPMNHYYNYFYNLFELAKQHEVKHLVIDISKYEVIDIESFVKEIFLVVKQFVESFNSITFALEKNVSNNEMYLSLQSKLNHFSFKC